MTDHAWYHSERLGPWGRTALLGLFVGVGLFYWGASRSAGSEGGDFINIATMLAKDNDPTLFPRDFAFATREYYGTYLPVYRRGLRVLCRVAGGTVPGHRLVLLYTVPAYLVAMFALLNLITGTWVAAAATALMSLTPRGSIHYGWGMGDLGTALPRTIYLAVFPALLWLMLRSKGNAKRWLCFAVLLGLSVNIHPLSAAMCLLAAAVFVLYAEGCGRAVLKRVGLLVVVFVLFSLPSATSYARAKSHESLTSADAVKANEILRKRFSFLFLDTDTFRFGHVGGWLWVTTVLGIAAKARARGLQPRDGAFIAVGVAMLGVSLLGTIALSAWADRAEAVRPLLFCLRGAKWIFLVHFVFLAVLVASLFEMSRRARSDGACWATGFAAACMVTIAILSAGCAAAAALRRAQCKPARDQVALLDVADWARAHTEPNALFHFDNQPFRLRARRSLTVCWKDGGTFAHSSHRRLLEWWRRYETHTKAMAARAPGRVLRLATELGADYLVMSRALRRLPRRVAYENERLVVYRLAQEGSRPRGLR